MLPDPCPQDPRPQSNSHYIESTEIHKYNNPPTSLFIASKGHIIKWPGGGPAPCSTL